VLYLKNSLINTDRVVEEVEMGAWPLLLLSKYHVFCNFCCMPAFKASARRKGGRKSSRRSETSNKTAN
jgi:hypothetical protein